MAALICAGILGACKKDATTATALSSSLNYTGYPMNAQDQSISWLVLEGYTLNSRYASADESPFHIYLQEMLGTKIDWSFPTTGTGAAQTYALVLADEKMPDVIFYSGVAEAEQLIDEGVIYDLSPYIKEWAPNYWNYLQKHPEADKSMKTDSGQYYSFGFFREDGAAFDTYLGPVVRKDWLEEQNLPVPETIADWENTLKVFRDKYGALLSFARSRSRGGSICGAFGAYTLFDFALYIDKNGKIQAANTQPEYRTYLTKLNEWWNNGIIDQNSLSYDDQGMRNVAINNKVGLTWTAQSQLSAWGNDAKTVNNGAQWVTLKYPRGNDGTLSKVYGGFYGIGAHSTVITTNCPKEKLELVMRALDYGYTEEGFLYWNN
jgi:putative aldouronate transport system substrate-binding protein